MNAIGFASLWRAVKRYSLLVFIFTLLSAGAGAIVWFFLPLPKMTGQVIFYVNSVQPGILRPDLITERDPGNNRQYQAALIRNRVLLNSVLQAPGVTGLPMFDREKISDPNTWLAQNLRIDYGMGMEYMRVSLEGDSSEELLAVLKALTEVYMKEAGTKEKSRRLARIEDLKKLSDRYVDQSKSARIRVNQVRIMLGTGDPITASLKERMLQNMINSTQAELTDFSARMRQIESLKEELEAELKLPPGMRKGVLTDAQIDALVANSTAVKDKQTRINQINQKLLDNVKYAADNVETPGMARLKEEKAAVEAEIKEILTNGRQKVGTELRESIATAEKNALQNYKESLTRLADLRARSEIDLVENIKKMNNLNNDSIQLEDLRREMASTDKMTEVITGTIEALKPELDAPSRVSLWDEPSAVSGVEGFRRLKYSAMAGGLFFLLGLVLAQWLEFRHRRIQSIDEVTNGLGLPVIGTVPAVPRGGPAAGKMNWPHLLTEAVNTTRTMLLSGHTPIEGQARTLLVTSAMSGEGKTSLTTHLAVSLAGAGRRVLLIDADMRRPAVHKVLGLEYKPGLAEVLTANADLAAVTMTCRVAGLHVLPAGTWSREAAAALSSARWVATLKEAALGYDFVLIDSPPILPVADALAISRNVDGVLLSVMQDLSRYGAVQSACSRLAMVGAKVLGVVVSGVPTTGGYYYYYYDERYSRASHQQQEPVPPVMPTASA